MLGFGFGYNRILPRLGDSFRPTDLAGTQLYYAKDTATPSLWNDQSPNGYDLSQGTAIQQPTIGVDTVDFDGVNDELFRTEANPFGTDTQGVFFFNLNVVSGSTQRIVINNSASSLTGNLFQISYFNNKIRLTLAANVVFETVDSFTTGNVYGYIRSNGTNYDVKLNGVLQSLSFSTGTNNGLWLNTITTNRFSFGRILNSTLNAYGANQMNKFYYNNTALSPTDMAKLETFFSDPNNY